MGWRRFPALPEIRVAEEACHGSAELKERRAKLPSSLTDQLNSFVEVVIPGRASRPNSLDHSPRSAITSTIRSSA